MGLGYFSVREGLGYDLQPIPPGVVIADGIIRAPASTVQDETYGDFDDVLALTTRSPQNPHVGTWRRRRFGNNDFVPVTIEGPDAEVLWFTLWNDPDGDGMPQPLDTKLYRRALVIMPNIQNPFPIDNNGTLMPVGVIDQWQRPSGNKQLLLQDFIDFYNYNDISSRAEIHEVNGTISVTMWANSLGDLTKRENRFCHRPLFNMDLSTMDLTAVPPTPPTVTGIVTDAILPSYYPFELYRHRPSEAMYSPHNTLFPDLTWLAQSLDRTGNDVVASHMVGFDLKVFDPTAWIIADYLPKLDATSALIPSDPGYPTKTLSGDPNKSLATSLSDTAAIQSDNLPHIARGAYVDLNYWRYLFDLRSGNAKINSIFMLPFGVQNDLVYNSAAELMDHASMYSLPPAYYRGGPDGITRVGNADSAIPAMRDGWRGLTIPTWDTWPTHYENNGYSEDGVNQNGSWHNKVDQGNNGFDDDGEDGVDDVGERETSPPYVTPLKSIKITLRMVESDSRQVRQISIIHDLSQ
jgi:hypothetical protein